MPLLFELKQGLEGLCGDTNTQTLTPGKASQAPDVPAEITRAAAGNVRASVSRLLGFLGLRGFRMYPTSAFHIECLAWIVREEKAC